jgi:hypothetical protein
MHWLIKRGVCKEKCYWTSDVTDKDEGRECVQRSGGSNTIYHYRYYICGEQEYKFNTHTYKCRYDGSNLLENDNEYYESPEGRYVRCVRKVE